MIRTNWKNWATTKNALFSSLQKVSKVRTAVILFAFFLCHPKYWNAAVIQENKAHEARFAKENDLVVRTHNENVQSDYIFGYDPDLATLPVSQVDTISVRHGDATDRNPSHCLCASASSFKILSSRATESESFKLASHKSHSKWRDLLQLLRQKEAWKM